MRVWVLMLLMALLPGSTAWAQPARSPVALHGHLSVRGTNVVDARGKPYAVRGMSLYWSQWKPQYYDAPTIEWLALDWRVSAVRAAIAGEQGGYEVQPDIETANAEQVIDAAIALGIYVVVDWHAHEPNPEAAVRFFTHIADRYRGVPNLIYEPWNEPLPAHDWETVIKPYHQRVIGAIRAIDPDAFVVAGTRSWSQDVDEAAASPLPFANVAYTLHFYSGTHKGDLRARADRARKRVALFVTEFGTTAADGNGAVDAAETRRWLKWCDRHHISYLNWSVTNVAEASAILRPDVTAVSDWAEGELTESGRLIRKHLHRVQ